MIENGPTMTDSTLPPYAELTPDVILNAIDGLGLRTSGHLLALNSYENRVYQLGLDEPSPWGNHLVAKFYRPARWSRAQILEEHAFSLELAGYEIPVVAPIELEGNTLHTYAGFQFALFPRRGGRVPELDQAGTREWIGRFLGRIHTVGARTPFAARPSLDLASFGEEPLAFLADCPLLPLAVRAHYLHVAGEALAAVAECYAAVPALTTLRLHGDCHLSNIMWTEAGPHFVDLDDARSGPAIQDLWMLLSGERHEQQAQLLDLLAGYEEFADFDYRELRLIEALRTLRLLHYSAWLARRWSDPAFPAAFSWFGSEHYWQERTQELQQQLLAMAEPPLLGGGNW